LTVIMATRNGDKWLGQTLLGFTQMEQPEGGWKLIIMDNGSIDDSKNVITTFKKQLPVTYVYHAHPGKNGALNAALRHREGDLVVLTDDDVIPDKRWLVELECAAKNQKEYAVFGGAILPLWPHQPKQWIMKFIPLGGVFAITDPSWTEGPCEPAKVWGANMAMRAEIFDKGYKFDASFGPDGSETYRMGSESSLCRWLYREGYKFWHVADAKVHHIIRPIQLTNQWMLKRAFRAGRGALANRAEMQGSGRSALFSLSLSVIRRIAYHALLYPISLASFSEGERVNRAFWIMFYWGQLYEVGKSYISRSELPRRRERVPGRGSV